MKVPKRVKRLCKFCKKHTEQTVKNQMNKGLNKAHSMTRGARAAQRERAGTGNHGKYSRKPINQRKMHGKKTTKKTDFRYTCTECKKISVQSGGIRAKRVEMI